MSNVVLNSIQHSLSPAVLKFLIIVLPIAIPLILIYTWWVLRLRYIQIKFIEKQKPCLLEIKLPKEIFKSPAAMEIFFSYLAPGGAGNIGEAFIDGETRPCFSCELVSTEGEVRFFIWCRQVKYKSIVEAQLYAQYPNVEIYEVPEAEAYTNSIVFDLDKYAINLMQFGFTKPDPYPIKTYIDYGLDQDQKDEYKIDPMTAVIEFLGSIKKGEHVWIQILIQKHEKEDWKHGVWKAEKDLKKETEKEIEAIRQKAVPKSEDDDEKTFKFPNPTKTQTEIITALERSAGKQAFDTMIRTAYIAEKSSFNKIMLSAMSGAFRQYGSQHLNGLKPVFGTDLNNFQKDISRIFPFLEKGFTKKVNGYRKKLFHAYKLRSFFQWPYKFYKAKPFIMTTEELATIFHFPSIIVSQTPTLKRVSSKKSEAPSNLPI